jgi:hypothetical protein
MAVFALSQRHGTCVIGGGQGRVSEVDCVEDDLLLLYFIAL